MSDSVQLEQQKNGEAKSNPFDPAKLRLSQDFAKTAGVKKVLTTVPCRKPNRHEFVRVRPGEDWQLETTIFEDKVGREVYLVLPEMWSDMMDESRPVCLRQAINRQGDTILWPTKLPGSDGRSNPWNESAIEAARLAETQWLRVAANMNAGYYDTFVAAGDIPEPEWPELSFEELLELCFRDRFIKSVDHPVLRALRGQS